MSYEISTLMDDNKDKVISIKLRNTKTIQGVLKDFDIHMNLTLEDAEDVSAEKPEKLGKILLRGDNIIAISMPKKES